MARAKYSMFSSEAASMSALGGFYLAGTEGQVPQKGCVLSLYAYSKIPVGIDLLDSAY